MTSVFLDFVRMVVEGDIDQVSRRLADTPALATTSSQAGATRQAASMFFFTDIAHHFYAGDTALHMAAAAFRPRVAELLIAHGADCRARNRRGAAPLHYAADANRWDPMAQAETIEYLLSVGADPNAVDMSGVAPLHRAVRTRSLAAVRALLDGGADQPLPEIEQGERFWMAGRTPDSQTRRGRRPCTLPFRPRGEEGVVLRGRANSRPASSDYCWNAAQE